jgi:acetyltransferase-like isoleucine patch superfamily enzyme
MSTTTELEAHATIGEGTIVEPNVVVGYRYHPAAGPATVGSDCILRYGTLIYGDVHIGNHCQTGHYTVIRAMVRMGDHCTITNHSTIEGVTRLGTGVRIMTNVYIPTRTWIGDHVFIGPGVTVLNDRYPGRRDPMPTPRSATIEDDVMIGGGVTILPGVRIGRRSFIAAGSLVVGDVPEGSFVVGRPGRISPLPPDLDGENNRALTIQPRDLWHPRSPHPRATIWPADWPEPWEDVVSP